MSYMSSTQNLDCCDLIPNRLIKGDLLVADANGVLQALDPGADGTVVTADSTQPYGVKYAPAGGVSGFTAGQVAFAQDPIMLVGNDDFSWDQLSATLSVGAAAGVGSIYAPILQIASAGSLNFSGLNTAFNVGIDPVSSDTFDLGPNARWRRAYIQHAFRNMRTVTVALALDRTYQDILANNASPFTITLPTAAGAGSFTGGNSADYLIKNIGVGLVTIASAGGNIDGIATTTIATNVCKRFHSDGTNWWIMS